MMSHVFPFRRWLSLLCCAGALVAFGCGATAAESRPNLLLIMSDDQGFADVGVNGAKDFATPHLDSIARNGLRCTAGYVSAPQCAPSRCGLLTGRYQQRFGYEYNNDSAGIGLPVSEKTLADRLSAGGYRTGLVGKWHLGKEPAFHPLERGFTDFFGFLAVARSRAGAADKVSDRSAGR
jgi:arylsulfatase A-like enzyme